MSSDLHVSRKPRVDGQITGLAGEFFVAAELLKRGFQTSVTFGNAKSIDLFATNPETGRMFTVQVKTIRKKNVFPISHEKVHPNCMYVFVILNQVDAPVQYFIVPGKTLKDERERFTPWFWDEKFPGINWRVFAEQGFENAWHSFSDASRA
jgi:hypothetical protein